MSDNDDKREAEDEMTRVIEPETDEHAEDEEWVESESDGWQDDDEELPPRPRNRLLAPLPIFLIAVLIAGVGFLGGVLIQKGSEEGSASGFPGGGELPAAFAAAGGEGEGGEGGAAAGLPTMPGGASDAAVTGTVSSVDGRTIYVEDADGNTVAVKAGDGSTITRDADTGVKRIRPGDSVVVQGSKSGSTVRASSVSATEAGIESGLPEFGGAGAAPEGEGDSVESLFGE
ncbi:MAG TPA: hypothetical protein VHR18_05970 [Solirubrobacterales bacterium]|nr:hypothetical protein [Solirubrobacterales bacterium]